eukprot:1151462-Pelagomonas_calceolata.AAC.5
MHSWTQCVCTDVDLFKEMPALFLTAALYSTYLNCPCPLYFLRCLRLDQQACAVTSANDGHLL